MDIAGLRKRHAAFVVLLVASLAVHLVIFGNGLDTDATVFLQMASSLVSRGTLETGTTLVARHPPMMALMLVPLGLLMGFSEVTLHLLEILFLGLDLVALYAIAGRWGPRAALVAPLLLSADPVLFLNMSEGRAVAPLILFALVTLWGIWRGLADSRWLVVAAIGAGLGFLTADSVGYLVVLAGAAGLLWRFAYVRWRVFLDRGYLAAIGIFLLPVGLWTAYNVETIGSPYTDPRVIRYVTRLATATPTYVAAVLVGGLAVYFLFFVAQAALPFLLLPEGRRALASLPRQAREDQRAGALVLFILTAVTISSIVSAAFILYEPYGSLGNADTYLRYVDVVAPLTYLAVAGQVHRLSRAGRMWRWAVPLAVALLLLSAQAVPKVEQGMGNAALFVPIGQELRAKGFTIVYTDEAIWLRYNVPGITFIQVDRGYSSPFVNLSTSDVPAGAPLLTGIYVPHTYDERLQTFYLVDRFDPALDCPFYNSFYGG